MLLTLMKDKLAQNNIPSAQLKQLETIAMVPTVTSKSKSKAKQEKPIRAKPQVASKRAKKKNENGLTVNMTIQGPGKTALNDKFQ